MLLALAGSLPALQRSIADLAVRVAHLEAAGPGLPGTRLQPAQAQAVFSAASAPLPATPPRPAGLSAPPGAPLANPAALYAQGGGYGAVTQLQPMGYGRGINPAFGDFPGSQLPPAAPPPQSTPTTSRSTPTTSRGHPMRPPNGSGVCYPFMSFKNDSPVREHMDDWYQLRAELNIPWYTCPNWMADGCPGKTCLPNSACMGKFKAGYTGISHPPEVVALLPVFRQHASIRAVLDHVKAHPLTYMHRGYPPKA